MIGQFALGDTAVMKKPHACGENRWTIIRTGADVKIRCQRCGRIVMLDRADFVRSCRRVEPAEPAAHSQKAYRHQGRQQGKKGQVQPQAAGTEPGQQRGERHDAGRKSQRTVPENLQASPSFPSRSGFSQEKCREF